MDKPTLLKMFQNAPVAQWMKAELEFEGDHEAVVTMGPRKEFIQATGVVHGAIICFAADTSAYFTAAAAAGPDELVTTASFSINFLRSASPNDGMKAKSILIKRGRTLVIVRTQVIQENGDLIAEGLWTHAVVGKRPTKAP